MSNEADIKKMLSVLSQYEPAYVGAIRECIDRQAAEMAALRANVAGLSAELATIKAEPLTGQQTSPVTRRIDWSTVKERVPVMVWDRGTPCLRFYSKYDATCTKFPHRAMDDCGYKKASLVTGQWVFNDKGENLWPEGVLVEAWLRTDTASSRLEIRPAILWAWSANVLSSDIIASRCTGLVDGWEW